MLFISIQKYNKEKIVTPLFLHLFTPTSYPGFEILEYAEINVPVF